MPHALAIFSKMELIIREAPMLLVVLETNPPTLKAPLIHMQANASLINPYLPCQTSMHDPRKVS